VAERIFIGVAWPYANGPLHLGHVAGAYLPADIFARYHRTRGSEVVMVSGSDTHGTPIMIQAEQENTTPDQIALKYHQEFLKSWEQMGITFDLFTNTETKNHYAVAQDVFKQCMDKGYIYKGSVSQAYCPQDKRFLPDRYIEGTCPFCKSPGARGDQCDACGKPMNPEELIQPKCRTCGTAPEFKATEHFFFKLSAFEKPLLEWVKSKDFWRSNVANFTQRYLEGGLNDRAITRDLQWGIPLPVEGYDSKRMYVWFEAVIGYLSATKEWAAAQGNPDKWKDFWTGDCKSYYFIGKDNIPFHTIIWPAMLMAYGGLNLPFDVPANEFLTIESKKLSTSKRWAVWLPDYLSRYDPDPLRYLMSINMPETNDTDFSWREFVRRNNDELVATYGNLVNRVLTFVYKNYDGTVPVPGEIDARSNEMIEKTKQALANMDKQLYACHFKEAIREALSLAQEGNRYLDEKSPWKAFKTDKQAAATALYTIIAVITGLRTAMYPFLPFTSAKLHEYLGLTGSIEAIGWKLVMPEPGHKLVMPKALFIKLEDSVVAEEESKLGH